jgi:hypothetical protein
MKIWKHLIEQPFVAATGAAALIHSTWSLATLFSGQQPESMFHLVGWLIPALLIAFALDVGQIATSMEIRLHGLTWRRGITFVTFAFATYYLQWLYMAHHMPALALADGVRQTWGSLATLMRDAGLFIIPALLPLSTLLYTFQGMHSEDAGITPAPQSVITPVILDDAQLDSEQQNQHVAECPACGWKSRAHTSQEAAVRALATHQSMHCAARYPVISANGARSEE